MFQLNPITLSVFSSLTDPLRRPVLHAGVARLRTWFKTWPWLHYLAGIDSVCYHTCCKALKSKKVLVGKGNWEPSFTVKGFNSWKDATTLFKIHQDSDVH